MKHLITIFIIFFLFSCAQNQEKVTVSGTDSIKLIAESDKNRKEAHVESKADTQIDSGSCDKTALEFVKLVNKNTRADFFHQLDSARKAQYPNNDHEPAIFVDLTPKLLDKFLKDLNKDQLEWCQESSVTYGFQINGDKISDFTRNEAG